MRRMDIGRRDVIDARSDEFHQAVHVFWSHIWDTLIKVIQILIERVTIQLYSDNLLYRRIRDAEGFL